MTATLTVRGRDLRILAGIVSEDRGQLPAHGLAPSLLDDLLSLIRCDFLSFVGLDTGQQANWFGQTAPLEPDDDWEETEEDIAPFWQHYWDSPSCSYPDLTGDLRSVTKRSDFTSARQWHNSGMHRDYQRDTEHEIMVCLPAGPGWTADPGRRAGGSSVRLLFFRGPGPDFSERDRDLLTLLRPHLHQAYLDAERRRRGAPQLTPRHWEVLHLVAAGHTNSQIARRLGVTEATVRKHLENIYARLHVSSRTAAVTRALPGPGYAGSE
jgi:DNA-binding CsgD family transcriptional regulator